MQPNWCGWVGKLKDSPLIQNGVRVRCPPPSPRMQVHCYISTTCNTQHCSKHANLQPQIQRTNIYNRPNCMQPRLHTSAKPEEPSKGAVPPNGVSTNKFSGTRPPSGTLHAQDTPLFNPQLSPLEPTIRVLSPLQASCTSPTLSITQATKAILHANFSFEANDCKLRCQGWGALPCLRLPPRQGLRDFVLPPAPPQH